MLQTLVIVGMFVLGNGVQQPAMIGLTPKEPSFISKDAGVIAFGQTAQGRLLFSKFGAFVGVPTEDGKIAVIQLGFSSEQRKAGIFPKAPLLGEKKFHYFQASPGRSKQSYNMAQALTYQEVWPGVDMTFLPKEGFISLKISIAPGAAPHEVALTTGAEKLALHAQGVSAFLGGANLQLTKLEAFQDVGDQSKSIPVSFAVRNKNRVGFDFGDFDKNQALTVSAIMSWSTLFGGNGGGSDTDIVYLIRINDQNEIIVGGITDAADFPVTPGVMDSSFNGKLDVFITKFSSDLETVLYSTFLGSSDSDNLTDMMIDAQGNLILTGSTQGHDFPTTANAMDRELNRTDAFVSKISADGSTLLFSTFLGGNGSDDGQNIIIENNGNVTVIGSTVSPDFPTTPDATYPVSNGIRDAFVTTISSDGSALLYSSYFGGSGSESVRDAILLQSGKIAIFGETNSTDLPASPGAIGNQLVGSDDQFITVLSTDRKTFEAVSYIGGESRDEAKAIGEDLQGNLIIAGLTRSSDYPVTPNVISESPFGSIDWVIAKLKPDLTEMIYGTYFGSPNFDDMENMITDTDGLPIIVGNSDYPDFSFSNGFDTTHNGSIDGLFVKLNDTGTDWVFASYFGGSEADNIHGVAVNNAGHLFLGGVTESPNFPTQPHEMVTNNSAFLVKISPQDWQLNASNVFGGSFGDEPFDLALDANGHLLLAGSTGSSTFPTTPGVFDQSQSFLEGFVTKVDSSGKQVLFSTFFGGRQDDEVKAIATNSAGEIVIAGNTTSTDFPTTPDAFSPERQGARDIFVAKLAGDGASLIYSTYFGGSEYQDIDDLTIGPGDEILLLGTSYSQNFPITDNAYDDTHNGIADMIISKFSGDGASLLYSTFFGGIYADKGESIAVSPLNEIVIAGGNAIDFPTTKGAFDETHNGGGDGFIAKFSTAGESLVFSTFLGGDQLDRIYDITITANADILFSGSGGSSFPVTPGAFDTTHSSTDGVVGILTADGSALLAGTYLGGHDVDTAYAAGVDANGNIVVTGSTQSSNFPVSANAFKAELQNDNDPDVFVTQFDCTLSNLVYSTYLGGEMSDVPVTMQKDDLDRFYILGLTHSPDFYVTNGVIDTSFAPDSEIFLTAMDLRYEHTYYLDPTTLVQGLDPLILNASSEACDAFGYEVQWVDTTRNQRFPLNQNPLQHPLNATHQTLYRFEVINPETRYVGQYHKLVLTSQTPSFFDINGDGCNNSEDIRALAPQWLTTTENDANGDQLMDVRDFLYINTSHEGGCPE